MKLLKDLILDPASALRDAKRKKDINKSFSVLIINSILLSLAIIILMAYSRSNYLMVGSVFVLNVFAIILFGFFLQLVFSILGGRGKFYEGLTSVAYSEFPLALAIFISSIFFPIPAIGPLLSLVLITVFGLIASSIFFRSIREFFGVDWIVILIGVGIILIALLLAIYSTTIMLALTKPWFLAQIFPKPTI